MTLGIIIIVALILILILMPKDTMRPVSRRTGWIFDSPQKIAGNKAEIAVSRNILYSVLNRGDVLITNAEIINGGQKTEIDNIIINRNGVFIVEVKNYAGELCGNNDDDIWLKEKTTEAGNVYVKEVRNPLIQVKRNEGILGRYLRHNGHHVWVNGYVYFYRNNETVYDKRILSSLEELRTIINRKGERELSASEISAIKRLLG